MSPVGTSPTPGSIHGMVVPGSHAEHPGRRPAPERRAGTRVAWIDGRVDWRGGEAGGPDRGDQRHRPGRRRAARRAGGRAHDRRPEPGAGGHGRGTDRGGSRRCARAGGCHCGLLDPGGGAPPRCGVAGPSRTHRRARQQRRRHVPYPPAHRGRHRGDMGTQPPGPLPAHQPPPRPPESSRRRPMPTRAPVSPSTTWPPRARGSREASPGTARPSWPTSCSRRNWGGGSRAAALPPTVFTPAWSPAASTATTAG